MFALESKKNLEPPKNKNLSIEKVIDKILLVYKKLKSIAKSETGVRNKFRLANLTQDRLNKLKSTESNLGLCLVAYEMKNDFTKQKIQILTQINDLLNDYSKLITQNGKKSNSGDDFSKFFE